LSKTKILTNYKILRVSIDEDWSSNDFINLIDSLDLLYKILLKFENNLILLPYDIKRIRKIDDNHEEYLIDLFDEVQIINGHIYRKINFSSIDENEILILNRSQDFSKNFLENDKIDRNTVAFPKNVRLQYSHSFKNKIFISRLC